MPGVQLHYSHRTEALAEALIEVLAEPLSDPFARELIAVQSTGMERWIMMQVAARLGVAANMEFPSPRGLVVKLLEVGLGRRPWRAPAITQAVLKALPGVQGLERFGGPVVDRWTLRFARRMGRIYERLAWWAPEAPHEGWRAQLWQALELKGESPAELVARLSEVNPERLPARICLFGVGRLSPLTVRALKAVAAHVPVHVFALRAAGECLLTQALGAQGRQLEASLGSAEAELHPPPASLLGALQAELTGQPAPDFEGADASLRFAACSGDRRQVEVVREALLEAFAELPDLQPSEVVVLSPDIERYVGLVQVAFGDHGELGAMPIHLADRGLRAENNIAEALLMLLRLLRGRLAVGPVLDFLALPPVRRRFGVAEDQLDRVQEWVVEAGVRWGADAAHRARCGQPPLAQNTWRFGIDRLLMGSAVARDPLVGGVLPFAAVRGKQERGLLGGLADFAERLIEASSALGRARPLREWRAVALDLLEGFFAVEQDEAFHIQDVRQVVVELTESEGRALDQQAFEALLSEGFGHRESGRKFLSGGVGFHELVPTRAIPFRVIVLMGMDDGVFPRPARAAAFDPQDEARAREADLALFMDALLCARERLVVTWTGRDRREGSPRPPAAPVQLLIDRAAALAKVERQSLIQRAPLFRAHPKACLGPRPAFDPEALEGAHAWLAPREAPKQVFNGPVPPPEEHSLTLQRLKSCLWGPATFFFRTRLGITLPGQRDAIPEREPTDLDGLAKWGIRDMALRDRLAGVPDVETAWWRAQGTGRLPVGGAARSAFMEAIGPVDEMARRVEALREAPPSAVEVALDFGDLQLEGRVDRVFGRRVVWHQAGRPHAKHLLALWLHHLALSAAEPGWRGESHLVAFGKHQKLRPVHDPRGELERLLTLYRAACCAPVHFYTKPCWALAEALSRGRSRAQGMQAALKVWDGRFSKDPDEYVAWVFGDDFPLHAAEEMSGWAEAVYRGLMSHLEGVP